MPTSRVTGHYVALTRGGRPLAFVPAPLPPVPALAIDADLRAQFDAALLALGRLDSISTLLPFPNLFLYGYMRKEALVSSRIEGTQSSALGPAPVRGRCGTWRPLRRCGGDVELRAALEEGLRKLKSGMPLSNRLIRDVALLSEGTEPL